MIPVAIAIYCLFLVGLGCYSSRRVASQEDYLVAGRKLPLWLAWGTLLATWFGAGTVIGASQAARDEGLRATLLDPFASGTALIVAGLFFARPMWKMQLLTMGDFFARRYGPRTEVVSSAIQAVSYFPWLAAQFVALGGLLAGELGWSNELATCVAAGLILFLTISGGMWSVTLTDTVQAFVLLLALLVLGHSFFASFGEGSVLKGAVDTWSQTPAELRTLLPENYGLAWLAWTSTLVAGVLGNVPGQDLMQRVFSARSASVAARACVLAGIVYLGFGLLPVMLGLASRIVLPDVESPSILNFLAAQLLSSPMRLVFVLALLSIVVSTATSALLSPSALLARNVFEKFAVCRRRPLVTDRVCGLASMLLSLGLAFAGQDVLTLLEQALEITLVALLVPFLAAFFGRPSCDRSGVLAILLGTTIWGAHTLGAMFLLPVDAEPATAQGWEIFWYLPSALLGLLASGVGLALGEWRARRC